MTEKRYQVEHTQRTVYLDDSGSAIDGYTVTVRLLSFGEVIGIKVPNLEEKTVKTAADNLVTQREKLAALGG